MRSLSAFCSLRAVFLQLILTAITLSSPALPIKSATLAGEKVDHLGAGGAPLRTTKIDHSSSSSSYPNIDRDADGTLLLLETPGVKSKNKGKPPNEPQLESVQLNGEKLPYTSAAGQPNPAFQPEPVVAYPAPYPGLGKSYPHEGGQRPGAASYPESYTKHPPGVTYYSPHPVDIPPHNTPQHHPIPPVNQPPHNTPQHYPIPPVNPPPHYILPHPTWSHPPPAKQPKRNIFQKWLQKVSNWYWNLKRKIFGSKWKL